MANDYESGFKDGIATGVTNERKRHELREWKTNKGEHPTEVGWYWFIGRVRTRYSKDGDWRPWHRYPLAICVQLGWPTGDTALPNMQYDGTWYGPIPEPTQGDKHG